MTSDTSKPKSSTARDPPSQNNSTGSFLARFCPNFAHADRGQASQIGFIIIIVTVLSLFTLAQVQLAPQVRGETEFTHGSEVISDFQNIHSGLQRTAKTGQGSSGVLAMGSTYPSYLILTHPPDPAGTLATEGPKSLEISNARAVNDETAQFVDGSTQSFEHHSLRYSPQYNEFNSAGDTVIEQGTLYQDFENSREVVASPSIVEGTKVSLIASTGDINIGSTQSRLVETTELSASPNTVVVEDTGDPIEIQFQSDLSESEWERILAKEIDEGGDPTNNRYITDVSKSGDTVTLTLQQGETYEVNYAKVGFKLGSEAGFPESEDPDVAYLTTKQATEKTVQAGGTVELTVETRDRFSNPAPQVVLDATATQGSITELTRVSRSDGTATYIYEAPDDSAITGTVTDTVTIEIDNGAGLPANQRRVTYEITVQSSS